MQLLLWIFTVAVLSWPIEMTPLEDIQKELTRIKMNIKNLEKAENDLKKKVEKLESNEDRMKVDIINMKTKISILEMNGISTETKIVNQNNRKENLKAQQHNLTDLKNSEDQNDEGTVKFFEDAVLDGKISHHENDCCDDLSTEIDKIKLNMADFNTSMNHLTERLNDNTMKIIANQFDIKSNTNNIDTNANKIQNNKEDIDSNANEIITNTNNVEDFMKRSDYCASQDVWPTDHHDQVITYDKLLLKNNHNLPGANLDIHKGLFTAGVEGIYQIDVSLRLVTTHHKNSEVYLRVNGVNVPESHINTYDDDNTTHNDAGGRYLLLELDAGDTVAVFAGDLDQNIGEITFCINLLK